MRALQLTAVLAVTGLLLALFARGISVGEVWAQIITANIPLLLLALATSLGTYALRAWRWQFLLRPVGKTHFSNALQATVMGFAASFVLPGRTGEVLRPYLLARREGLHTVAAFATVVVERLLDLIGVLLLFATVLFVARPVAVNESASVFRAVQIGGLTAGAVSLVAFFVLVLIARYPDASAVVIQRVTAVLPATLGRIINNVVKTFLAGLMILREPKDAALALAGSIPLWCGSALTIWAVCQAFHLGIPASGAFILMMLTVIGVSVPTPGGVGAVHYAFRFGATALYAAADDRAVGAAIVFHAISVIPVSVIGVLLAAREGLSLKGLAGLASGSTAAPAVAPRIEPVANL